MREKTTPRLRRSSGLPGPNNSHLLTRDNMLSPLRRILWLLVLTTIVLVSGTLGFHFVENWSLFDSFYMTLMTLTTVGYGEVHPLSSSGRVVASVLMLAGVATVFIAFGIMVDVLIKLELAD